MHIFPTTFLEIAVYMGYIGMYRPIGYGFEGLDKNRLTLFDLVSVVYPV